MADGILLPGSPAEPVAGGPGWIEVSLAPEEAEAAARLEETGEWIAAHDRHLTYFAAWMGTAVARLDGPEQTRWLARISAVHHHLRSALDWALDPRADFHAGLRLAVAALGYFSILSGHLQEGLERARAILTRATAEAHRPLRAQLLVCAARLAWYRSEYAQALAWSQEAVSECQLLGDLDAWAEALLVLGVSATHTGQPALARTTLETAVAHYRARGNPYRLSWALVSLARVRVAERVPGARALAEEALGVATQAGDNLGVANALWMLGDLLKERGDFAAAAAVYARGVPVARALGNRITLGGVLVNLAITHHLLDDHAATGRYAAEALALFRDLGDAVQQPFLLRLLGYVALEGGDWSQAQALFLDGLDGNRVLGHETGQIAGLVSLAALALARADQDRAAQLAGCAQALLEAAGQALLPPDARSLGRLAAALDRHAAWAAGRALTLEQGLALAQTLQPV